MWYILLETEEGPLCRLQQGGEGLWRHLEYCVPWGLGRDFVQSRDVILLTSPQKAAGPGESRILGSASVSYLAEMGKVSRSTPALRECLPRVRLQLDQPKINLWVCH